MALKRCASCARGGDAIALCTSAVATPASRAASAGCGVSSVGALRPASARARAASTATRFSASASSASGTARAYDVAEQRPRGVAAAQARPADDRIGVARERVGGGAQHQLGLHEVDFRPRVGDEADPDLADPRGRAPRVRPAALRRPSPARRRGWRACRTCPCGRCVAAVPAPRRPAARSSASRGDGPARRRSPRDRARGDATLTSPARSGPSPVSRPGFQAMNVAVAVARIASPCARPVSASSPLGRSSASTGAAPALAKAICRRVGGAGGPGEADAEQPVDDELAAPAGRDRRDGRAAAGAPGRQRRSGVGGQAGGVAGEDDGHLMECRRQQSRDDEGVPAVVAGTRQHQHPAAAGAGHPLRHRRRGSARAFHQRGAASRLLDLPQHHCGVDGGQGGGRGRLRGHPLIIGGAGRSKSPRAALPPSRPSGLDILPPAS